MADVLAALKATTTGTPTFSFVGTATPHAVAGCSLAGLSSVTVTQKSATKLSTDALAKCERSDHPQRSANYEH